MTAPIEARLALDFTGFGLDVDLQLPGAGFSALFGASASGKTSCLRAIAGLLRARGRLDVGGEVWQDDVRGIFVAPHRRAVGMVFQQAALFGHLNVRGNLEFAHRRVPAAQRRVAFDHVVDLLGLEPLLERKPDRLSGGEAQRVAIGRALSFRPRVMLLDEPLNALDEATRDRLCELLRSVQERERLTMLHVTHSRAEARHVATRHYRLDHGRVNEHPLEELAAPPAARSPS